MNAVARQLDARALPYVKGQLQLGKELSRRVLQSLNIDAGTVIVFAPVNSPESSLYQFTVGGMRAWDREGGTGAAPNDLLLRAVSDHLRRRPDALVVIEDETHQADDRALKRFPSAPLSLGQAIYHLLRPAASAAEIEATVRLSTSAWLNVVFFSNWRIETGTELSERDVAGVARETRAIAISVYDLESWLLWMRPDLEMRL